MENISQYKDLGNLWPDRSPVHQGPIRFVEGMNHRGGGRGVIATEDIKPGTILVAEAPYLKWPTDTGDDPLNVAMIKKILQNKRKDKILSDLAKVHPVQTDIVPLDLIHELEAQYGSHIDKLVSQFSMKREQILRLFLVLQCSAHSTGLYLYLSLFNHDSRPNAIKFTPNPNSPASEMRAVAFIKKGEEITFSYLEPRERTRAKQHLLLRKQFGFVPSFEDPTRDELIEKWKNPDNPDLDFVSDPCIISPLKNPLFGSTLLVLKLEEDLDEFVSSGNVPPLATLKELRAKALEILDPRHILLLRLNKVIIEAVMPYVSGEIEEDTPDTALSQSLVTYIDCAFEVYKTQLIFLPKDHIDLATTLNDLAQGIEALLIENKNLLFRTFPQWDSYQKATKFQQFCLAGFKRLDDMYM